MMWVENHQVPAREWVAVYYDNPEEVPAEKLRCATAVTVDEDYVIPANSEGVILAAIAGGDYACARARVVDYDFATPWMQFFDSLQQSTAYRIAPQPCLRSILTTATTTATGISTCMFPLSASRRSSLPLFRTRFFTFPACSGRKSSYNWPFRFAGEGCAR
ncbi:DNA gyrase inhibitory protein [Klebsiella pneumoniae subsp. pneumoniae]|nr:DNA gyrase inhibitory protein [Klebsiella pneumoniae subsp. pneumoniae]